MSATAGVLNARAYALLAVGFLAFAIFGSLVPFDYHPLPFEQALALWRSLDVVHAKISSRSDFVANILLFVPLGWFFMGAACVDRPRWVGLLAAAFVAPLCAGLSLVIECSQVYFPSRVFSASDIVAESLGGLVGTSAWLALGQRATDWARGAWTAWGRDNLVGRVLPGYLVLLVVIHVLPLDLTISPVEIYKKYKRGQIVLMPFGTHYEDDWQAATKMLWQAVFYAPLGVLLAFLPEARRPRSWVAVLGWGLLCGCMLEFLQLFVLPRNTEANDVLSGGAAVLGGWCLARAWPRRAPAALVWSAVLAVWLAVAVFVEWQPFNFRPDPDAAAERWHEVSFIPFADYQAGNYGNFLDQVLKKSVLFMPLGVIVRLGLLNPAWPGGAWVAAAAAALIAAALEAGQLFLPGRYTSVTDVLVATTGGWVGAVLAGRAWRLTHLKSAPCEVPGAK
jgi:glycopeptide antibiotics resistance protein